MEMHHVRRGKGKPLLLIHGLGGSWRSWGPILDALAAERDVIAVDLPGFGGTPPLAGEVSIATLADAVTDFLTDQKLIGVDAVGSSMGARLVIELARRGEYWARWSRSIPAGFGAAGNAISFMPRSGCRFVSCACCNRLCRCSPVMPSSAPSCSRSFQPIHGNCLLSSRSMRCVVMRPLRLSMHSCTN